MPRVIATLPIALLAALAGSAVAQTGTVQMKEEATVVTFAGPEVVVTDQNRGLWVEGLGSLLDKSAAKIAHQLNIATIHQGGAIVWEPEAYGENGQKYAVTNIQTVAISKEQTSLVRYLLTTVAPAVLETTLATCPCFLQIFRLDIGDADLRSHPNGLNIKLKSQGALNVILMSQITADQIRAQLSAIDLKRSQLAALPPAARALPPWEQQQIQEGRNQAMAEARLQVLEERGSIPVEGLFDLARDVAFTMETAELCGVPTVTLERELGNYGQGLPEQQSQADFYMARATGKSMRHEIRPTINDCVGIRRALRLLRSHFRAAGEEVSDGFEAPLACF
jgi:hypothetical protein